MSVKDIDLVRQVVIALQHSGVRSCVIGGGGRSYTGSARPVSMVPRCPSRDREPPLLIVVAGGPSKQPEPRGVCHQRIASHSAQTSV